MPKGEKVMESHLVNEVEEIKGRLVEMNTQNQQLGDSIRQLQV